MAVLAGIPQVSVKVRVAGEIATEYEAPSDQVTVVNAGPELPTTHCYIEAKSGAKFGIEMTVDSCFPFPLDDNAVAMFVYIDGAWMKGVFIRSDSFLPQETAKTMEANDTLCRADQEGGEPLIKDFMFSPIVTNDTTSGEDMTSEIERAKGLGVIKVVLGTGRTGPPVTLTPIDGLQGEGRELPEKALKGRELSHRGTLATSTRLPDQRGIRLLSHHEVGTFFFHYRSHVALQREMIIPRSPSPGTDSPIPLSPVETGLSNLSEGEIRRLAEARLRDLQAKGRSRGIKREAESVPRVIRPLKVIILDNGKEAFDLTDD